MKKSLLLASLISSRVLASEGNEGFRKHVGILAFGDKIPVPAFNGSFPVGSFAVEFTLGTLLVSGAADLGLRYEFAPLAGIKPSLILRSGANYSITSSSFYYAPTGALSYGRYTFEAGPVVYYRRDFENSRDLRPAFTGLAGIMYRFY